MDQDQSKKKYKLSFQFNHPSSSDSPLAKKEPQSGEKNIERFVQEVDFPPTLKLGSKSSYEILSTEEEATTFSYQLPSVSNGDQSPAGLDVKEKIRAGEEQPVAMEAAVSAYAHQPDNASSESYEYQGYTYEAVSNRKRHSGRWVPRLKKSTTYLLVAGSAVVVGLIFGLAVLSIFSNLAEDPQTQAANLVAQPTLQERIAVQAQSPSAPSHPSTSDQTTEANSPVTGNEERTLSWPARTYFFVQAGAFSEYQAAQVMLQQYVQSGYPARISDQETPFRLFVGVSLMKQDAQALAQYYDALGLESYVKELVIPEANFRLQQSDAEAGESITSLLEKGDQLLNKLSELAAQGLGTEGLVISIEEWKHIQGLHKEYIQLSKLIWEQWAGEERQLGLEMNKQLTTAVDAVETYRQQSHDSYLWSSQQALLNYVETYKTLVQSHDG